MTEDADQGSAVRVLSYNLWHGRAQGELAELVAAHDPDVLCIQEARSTGLPQRLGDLQLAVTTPRNRLGVALYVRASRFTLEAADSFQLTESRHDRLVGGTDRRLAAARVIDRLTGRGLVLGSFHATPFTDSNAVRRRQIDDAHAALEKLGPGLAFAMAGDFNHPILLFMLRAHLRLRGLSMGNTTTSTFQKDGSIMRGKFDLATASGLDVTEATVLPGGASDHKPVLFVLDYFA